MMRYFGAVIVILFSGCGLTVTNERPTYEQLDQEEKDAVAIILSELTAFNEQIKARTSVNIDAVVNREAISVSFEGVLFSGNLGDNVIHIAVWENLSDMQRSLIQQWFADSSLEEAQANYEKMFYRFLAVSQGAKQYMYEVLTRDWVFMHRSIFNVERDSIRVALSHYVAVEGPQSSMLSFLETTCSSVLSQYADQYSAKFSKEYLRDHVKELLNPQNPTGYMYFTCRWIQMSMYPEGGTLAELSAQLAWINDLPNREEEE